MPAGWAESRPVHPAIMGVLAMLAVIKEHIEATPGICGGKPRIAGHRIRVMDIAVCYEDQGLSPDEIASAYPGLSLADIHAALTFFFDHREDVRRDIQEERRHAEETRRKTPSLLKAKLREAGGG